MCLLPIGSCACVFDLVVLDCTATAADAADAAVTATNTATADCLLLAPHPTRYISRFWTRFSYSL